MNFILLTILVSNSRALQILAGPQTAASNRRRTWGANSVGEISLFPAGRLHLDAVDSRLRVENMAQFSIFGSLNQNSESRILLGHFSRAHVFGTLILGENASVECVILESGGKEKCKSGFYKLTISPDAILNLSSNSKVIQHDSSHLWVSFSTFSSVTLLF